MARHQEEKHSKTIFDPTTGEEKEVNNNFVQIYKDNIDLLIQIGNTNKMSLNIFLWISKHMDNKNALVVSQNALAEVFGVSTRTIISAINYLKEVKALKVIKSGNSNIYALNTELVWQKADEHKQYAHFTAKVYVTKSEQDDYKAQTFAHALKKPIKKPKKIKQKIEKSISDFENEKVIL